MGRYSEHQLQLEHRGHQLRLDALRRALDHAQLRLQRLVRVRVRVRVRVYGLGLGLGLGMGMGLG